MAKITSHSAKLKAKLSRFEKKATAIHKRQRRLDASQNALRVVESAIGGKLIEKSRPR
jgi:hypothetical protein